MQEKELGSSVSVKSEFVEWMETCLVALRSLKFTSLKVRAATKMIWKVKKVGPVKSSLKMVFDVL